MNEVLSREINSWAGQSYWLGRFMIFSAEGLGCFFVFLVLENVNQLINHETTGSMPSGHASFYFALATGVCLYNKKAGYIYLILAGLMGFARIFSGVHWPLDIIV